MDENEKSESEKNESEKSEGEKNESEKSENKNGGEGEDEDEDYEIEFPDLGRCESDEPESMEHSRPSDAAVALRRPEGSPSSVNPVVSYDGWPEGLPEIHAYLSSNNEAAIRTSEWMECVTLYIELQKKGDIHVSRLDFWCRSFVYK